MKKIIVLGIAFVAITVLLCVFFYKKEVPYSAFYRIDITDFRPDAYVVFHEEDDMLHSAVYLYHGAEIEKAMKGKFDFSRYSYVIVYGAQIDRMYYSFKSTLFDDKSPWYASARRYHKHCLFVEYKEPDGNIYIYQIDKNIDLTGFGGA